MLHLRLGPALSAYCSSQRVLFSDVAYYCS